MQYIEKAYGDHEMKLEEQEVVINAPDEDVAYLKANMIFPEYKELGVTEVLEQPTQCRYDENLPCGYPIDDCDNCPANPKNYDPYWHMTKAVIS